MSGKQAGKVLSETPILRGSKRKLSQKVSGEGSAPKEGKSVPRSVVFLLISYASAFRS